MWPGISRAGCASIPWLEEEIQNILEGSKVIVGHGTISRSQLYPWERIWKGNEPTALWFCVCCARLITHFVSRGETGTFERNPWKPCCQTTRKVSTSCQFEAIRHWWMNPSSQYFAWNLQIKLNIGCRKNLTKLKHYTHGKDWEWEVLWQICTELYFGKVSIKRFA